MTVNCVFEYNGKDTLLHAENFVGAFTRGSFLDVAIAKMPYEINCYLQWLNLPMPSDLEVKIVQDKHSDLNISDADTDVIFDSEKLPLTAEEYAKLKALCLKSAHDFFALYSSVPDKDVSAFEKRKTFYGEVPRTAREMYEHTKNVNNYYFGEIGVDVDNGGTIYECRKRGLEALEKKPEFLTLPTVTGSYDEQWSLRKVLRRFVWHDRIHAKALYRMARKTFDGNVENIFKF